MCNRKTVYLVVRRLLTKQHGTVLKCIWNRVNENQRLRLRKVFVCASGAVVVAIFRLTESKRDVFSVFWYFSDLNSDLMIKPIKTLWIDSHPAAKKFTIVHKHTRRSRRERPRTRLLIIIFRDVSALEKPQHTIRR